MDTVTGLYIALVLLVVVIPILLISSKRRKDRNLQESHTAQLGAFAQQMGGTLSTVQEANLPRSAALRPVFNELVNSGFLNDLTVQSKPRYDYALDFQRRGWQVRITEASVGRSSGSGGNSTVKTVYEHRIEILTNPLPAFRVSPALGMKTYRHFGRTVTLPDPNQRVFDAELSRPPSSMVSRDQQWAPAELPAQYAEHIKVFTSNHQFAAETFDGAVLDWLARNKAYLRHLITVEQGVLYAVGKDPVEPETVLTTVDALIGFLERIPAQALNPSVSHASPAVTPTLVTSPPQQHPPLPAPPQEHSPAPANQPGPLTVTKVWRVLGLVLLAAVIALTIVSFLF